MSLNAEAWTPIEVADWVAGLDPSGDPSSHFATYSASFLSAEVTGRLLLNLMGGDLKKYGVDRVGDQLLLLEAIQFLRYELDTPRITLQSLASTLAVRCRNYRTELSSLQKGNHIPTESLASASFLLDASKILIRWLTRLPFLGQTEYDDITVKLTKHCFELAMQSQRDSFADNATEEVQYLCTKIIEICENIINSKDSLVIQPAAVDVITLRKRTEQELGLQLESSYFGLHQVSSVRLSSPAQSGHLEKGDEILQINYQTVVGWPQNNVVSLLTENANEVILTVKRRPRHATANILGQMYLRPSNKLMGSTHRSQKRHHPGRPQTDAKGHLLPTSLPPTRRHPQKSMPISPVPEDENSSSSTSSSSGTTPVVVVDVNIDEKKNVEERQKGEEKEKSPERLSTTVSNNENNSNNSGTEDSSSTPLLTTGQSLDTLDSDDSNIIITPAVPSPNPARITEEGANGTSDKNVALGSKFWKLYPRPRNLIRRRATVTGASPTSTRPPVTFFDDNEDRIPLRPPLINSKSAPEKIRIGLKKQGHIDRQTVPPSIEFDLRTESERLDLLNKDKEDKEIVEEDLSNVSISLKGVLHLRQSPANLLVKSNSLTSTLSGTGFSPHPRWTRHPAVLYSNQVLQIGSDPHACLKIDLSSDKKEVGQRSTVSLAKEVHSRPFAFKIDVKNKSKEKGAPPSGIFYLAAECQQEYECWMRNLLPPETCEIIFKPQSQGSGMRDLMYQKLRNSAPPAYKRSISLGNSPAHSRRASLMNRGSESPSRGSSASVNNQQDRIVAYQNRSFILRKNNLLRSSKLVGNSTPNVQALALTSNTPLATGGRSTSTLSSSTPKRRTSESVKSEWFNAPTTPTTPTAPRSTSRFLSSTPTAPPYRSQPISASRSSSKSNISSITIKSMVRKSTDEPSSNSGSPSVSPTKSNPTPRSTSTSKPCMGMSIVLAKGSGQSPLSSPVKKPSAITVITAAPGLTDPSKERTSSSSSSSDVFIKSDSESAMDQQHQHQRSRADRSCPSCGGSSSSFSKADKSVSTREISTQTDSNSSPNLEVLRAFGNLIQSQEESTV